ncbi:tenascin-X [Corallococcus sp. M34]|uniref:tenascin-X n=1 Tax=Citreicoccus inhibens TaxID=2849499 RepID=UPI001C221796|nr:tenascin-X [Citreicoccus inhibens]MBU8897200.1 tenascin-X [Citreicoccus inhibens]
MSHGTNAGGAVRASLLLTLGLVMVTACRETPPLTNASARLRVSQEHVTFPPAYPQLVREAEVRVENAGRASLDITWSTLDMPFTAEGLPTRLAPGDAPVKLRFLPPAEGHFTATLTGTAPGGGTVTLVLEGESRPVPTCPVSTACHLAHFDVASELCVEDVLPDGTACDPGNACLIQATCQQGRCKGTERFCDDGNACTTDLCHPLDGCRAVPAPPCPGDGKCQVGACDPKLGCGLAPAPDGTFCGSARGCDAADVCIEGACLRRDLPDGFTCAPASPCQGAGHCQGPLCERPPALALKPDWTYDANITGEDLHDVLVGPEGDFTLVGFFAFPLMDAAGAQPVLASRSGRRCMLWNDRLLCMDMPNSGQVSLLDRSFGLPRWTFDLATNRPDFAAQASTLFMARLAVIQPDRLAALFEAYPDGQDRNSLCRRYFLVVLDAMGHMVSAQRLEDPLLSECNHPHPFGVVSDAVGDLYVAFSQTLNQGAPLQPGAPTLLMAFSQDGVPRWRKTEAFTAGELAVVNGLLLNERGTQALRTQDGAAVELASFPSGLGRPVATSEVLVSLPAPTTQTNGASAWSLEGHRLAGLGPTWRYTAPANVTFISRELRLATWPEQVGAPPETLALGFAHQDSGTPVLLGVRARDGSEAFRCALASPPLTRGGAEILMELGPDQLVLLDGTTTCGDCDPPFAYSRARFQRFQMPGIRPASEPWPGTFGGPGHSHHENPVQARSQSIR